MNFHFRLSSLFLFCIFIYWIVPDIFSYRLDPAAHAGQAVISRRILGVPAGRQVYGAASLQGVAVTYRRAYFDLKMRGLFRVELKLQSGKAVVLHQLQTPLRYEPGLLLGPDLIIKKMQACAEARGISERLALPLEGC